MPSAPVSGSARWILPIETMRAVKSPSSGSRTSPANVSERLAGLPLIHHAVERGELAYDRHLLNFQSKFVALVERGTERSVVIPVNRHLAPLNILRPATGVSASFGRPFQFRVSKGSLPPLATRGRDYAVQLPDVSGDYRLEVRLNYRHLPPVLLDRVGTPYLKHLLEIVVIDDHESVVRVDSGSGVP